ncbi:DUF3592 domain-containing protein [Pseudoalteromonas marina]|jgi:hypothetical protein|uniref:DUF3592 domain-containing protein n=2 Tax=Pseudoalteromonas marina TaxID=267375 RepID=A0ABT9FA44_9GAMM|nr:DUF3592 domain-containing protein [Pseudoalteromonas marina]
MSSIINRMNNSLKVSYLYLLLGVLAVIVGIFVTTNTIEFTQQAINTKGKVSSLVVIDTKIYPEVAFSSSSNETHKFISNSGCKPACYKKGESVNVLYLPNQPNQAQLNSFVSLWVPTLLTCGKGSIFIVFSLLQIKRLKV